RQARRRLGIHVFADAKKGNPEWLPRGHDGVGSPENQSFRRMILAAQIRKAGEPSPISALLPARNLVPSDTP
ncbi:MAG: hypothetical protein ACREF3_11760, partial [Acetobacteraceae bacterium]